MPIANISSVAYAATTNPYQYQGDNAEQDDETGWNDFELRTYDPQTLRWLQVDPYDEFASPYVGMGNDPVNNIDPNGGDVGDVVGPFSDWAFGNHLAWGVAGAIAGAIADKNNPLQGAAEGFGAGFGLSFVPWGKVGTGLLDAGSWVGGNIGNLFQTIPVFNVYYTPDNQFSYEHIKTAQDQGYPKVVTYDGNKQDADDRHDEGVEGYPEIDKKYDIDRDIYPPKCVYESGIINPLTGRKVSVMYMPASDNRSLGGKLGNFIRTNHITNNMKFKIHLVEPDKKRIPIPVISPSTDPANNRRPDINLKPIAVGVGTGGILGLLIKIAEFLRLVVE